MAVTILEAWDRLVCKVSEESCPMDCIVQWGWIAISNMLGDLSVITIKTKIEQGREIIGKW